MQEPIPAKREQPDNWTLIRDASVLQFKLIVDGLRDFLLVPASLVAAVISLAKSKDGTPGTEFYQLLDAGKRSERWINLFGARANAPEEAEAPVQDGDPLAGMNIDQIVGKVEAFIVDEYQRGGMTAQAKAKIDKALNAILERRRASRRP